METVRSKAEEALASIPVSTHWRALHSLGSCTMLIGT